MLALNNKQFINLKKVYHMIDEESSMSEESDFGRFCKPVDDHYQDSNSVESEPQKPTQ